MAQHRPPPPAGEPSRRPLHVSRGGWHHHVDARAADTLGRAADASRSIGRDLSELTDEVAFTEAWDQIGWRGVQSAFADDGQPHSRSTIYTWTRGARGGRRVRDIPARVAALIQRRALIARRGGLVNAADELGVSASAVSRWQSGQTENLRGAAADALDKVRLHDAQERAGHPPIRGASIQICARIEYRSDGDEYLESRRPVRNTRLHFDAETAENLAIALNAGNHAKAATIIEAAWTDEWDSFADYSDTEGVHLVEVEELDIEWM